MTIRMHRFLCLSCALMLWLGSAVAQEVPAAEAAPDTAWIQPLHDLVSSPDPGRPDLLADSIRSIVVFDAGDLWSWLAYGQRMMPERDTTAVRHPGQAASPKSAREGWVIWTIGLLALLLALVKVAFPGEFLALIRGYYDNTFYNQLNKEENFFGSWPMVFLYVLSGFSTGIFVYLGLEAGISGSPGLGGFRSYTLIAVSLMLFFALKIGLTHLMGFIFDIRKLTKPYTTLIHLAYRNMAILVLPFAFMLSLLPYRHVVWLAPLALLPVLSILIYRGVGTMMDLFYNYRFPKFYLFVYLCTLEIAPILILIKVLFR